MSELDGRPWCPECGETVGLEEDVVRLKAERDFFRRLCIHHLGDIVSGVDCEKYLDHRCEVALGKQTTQKKVKP